MAEVDNILRYILDHSKCFHFCPYWRKYLAFTLLSPLSSCNHGNKNSKAGNKMAKIFWLLPYKTNPKHLGEGHLQIFSGIDEISWAKKRNKRFPWTWERNEIEVQTESSE